MVVAFGNLSTFSWKQVIRVLGISFVAIMCATLGWFVYQSWRFVWTMESVVAGTLIPEEQATIINQAEAIRQQLELDIKPSLDNSYPLASTETLDLVTGRWQIIEDWDNGLCWYSWGRTQREGRHELRVMEISDHFIVTSIQHPWDHEPQIERSIKSNADRIGVIDKTESQLAVHKTLVVFDADGPMTFLSQSASDIQNGQFEGSVRGFPANVTNGFVSRGIIAPDSDRLYLFGTSEDEVGQNLPNPEWVPLRPHVAGTHLTVLRRFSADWKYPPDGIDIPISIPLQ